MHPLPLQESACLLELADFYFLGTLSNVDAMGSKQRTRKWIELDMVAPLVPTFGRQKQVGLCTSRPALST